MPEKRKRNQTINFHKKMEHPTEGRMKLVQGKLSCDSCSFTKNSLSHTTKLEAMRLKIPVQPVAELGGVGGSTSVTDEQRTKEILQSNIRYTTITTINTN